MLVMAASSVIFSAMSLLVPFARPVSTYVVASSRFIIGGAAILALGLFGALSLKAVNLWWLLIRGLFGATSVYLYYRGIVTLGLGMGTVLNYTYPVFAAILAPIILKEKLAPDVIAAVAVYPDGIMRLLSGSSAGGRAGISAFFDLSVNGLLSLLGGVLAAVAVVAIKKLRETDSSSVIYLAQCIFGVVVIGWPTATSSFAFAPSLWIILLAIGVLATVAQLLMTYAYKHVPATEGSLLAFLVPVLNVALGVLVFAERMGLPAVIGCVLVLLCCAWVALRERFVKAVQ
jgi:drug/metabolite transporter (DMT)-like permease